MVALFITSGEKGAGKTAIAAGLAKHWQDKGKKIGFFKPVVVEGKSDSTQPTDSDAAFFKQQFALEEPPDVLSPVIVNGRTVKSHIKEAYAKVSADKDIVLIESSSEPGQAAIIEALQAKVIVITAYSKEPLAGISSYQDLGKSLLGIVFNKVPRNRLEQVRVEVSAHLKKSKINLLGILPEDRVLLAPTIGELAEHIPGEFFSGADMSGELVESLMTGAMVVGSGPDYFGRKNNKMVIVRSDRADMQIAALETSTRALVLTGNTAPIPSVKQRAEQKQAAIILAKDNIVTVAANIEDVIGNGRLNQPQKLARLTQIMEHYFDFPAVDKGIL